MNSPIANLTTRGWSETCSNSMPTGSSERTRAMVRSRSAPSLSTSPLDAIDTASPIASRPSKRMAAIGGSAVPRVTVAMSPSRKVWPFARSSRLADLAHRIELPGHAQRHGMATGLDAAGAGDRVLRLQRRGDLLRVDAERGELLRRELDEDAVFLDAYQLRLCHIGEAQHLLAHALDVVAQLRVREAVGGEGVDRAEHVAELVVEERPQHLRRQRVADVVDLLAHLVPDRRHVLGRRGVEELEEDERLARARIAARPLVVGRLLQLPLDAVGDLAVDLLRRGARPERADHHGAEGEVGVLALPELEVRGNAARGDHDAGRRASAAGT